MKTNRTKLRTIVGVMLMAMLLMSTSAVGAFAADTGSCVDKDKVNLTKLYKILNPETVSPAETFSFTISKVGVTDSTETVDTMPEFAQTTYTVAQAAGAATIDGNAATNEISLPEFDTVGIYTYKIQEVAGDTAGVDYNSKAAILKVTVINCQEEGQDHLDATYTMAYEGNETTKIDSIDNTFKAGQLDVSKEVTGILGDVHKIFDVTVSFTAPAGRAVRSDITYTDDGNKKTITAADWNNGTATAKITVKDGETISFKNIPYGVTYTVVEDDYSDDKYDTSYTESDPARKIDSVSDTVTVINSKGGTIPTGVYHNVLLIFVGLLAVVTMLAIVVVRRRRNMEA